VEIVKLSLEEIQKKKMSMTYNTAMINRLNKIASIEALEKHYASYNHFEYTANKYYGALLQYITRCPVKKLCYTFVGHLLQFISRNLTKD